MNQTDGGSALDLGKRYTLANWRSWPKDERWELIDGAAYSMSPAPRVKHQERAFNLGHDLANYLEDKPCKVYMAPLDVFLPIDDNDHGDATGRDTVVQPDVLAMCDPGKIHEDGIHGSPDFVAEVLSDATANKDFGVKRELYEKKRRAGILDRPAGDRHRLPIRARGRHLRAGAGVPPRRARSQRAVFGGFSWVCG